LCAFQFCDPIMSLARTVLLTLLIALKLAFEVLAQAATSIAPTSAYVGSTITVTGTNFIPGFACTARVGATPSSGTAATSCSVPSVSSVVVVIGAGTPAGASSVEVTFTNGAAVATVSGTTLTMLLSPTAVSIAPTSAYVGSTITVTGTNFIPGFACTARVGATPSSGTAATSCLVLTATRTVVVIGAGTPAGASSVEVTFTNGAAVATVSGTTLTMLLSPTAVSIAPTSAYVGSTITVTGTNFIPGFACTARVGATPSSGTAATSCLVPSVSSVVVVIGAGTPAGASSVEVTFTNGAAVATVSGTTLTMLLSPTAVSIAPTSAYVGSTITVTGTNFIPGFACTARVGATPSSGTAATSCSVPSVSSVVVVIGAGTPAGASSVEVTFTNGAAVATVSGTTLTMLLSPTAVSIAPTSAYVGSTITVTGTNFIPGFACTARVGATPSSGTAATSCLVLTATRTVVVIGAGTPAGASSVEVTFSNDTNGQFAGIFSNINIIIRTFPTAVSIAPTSAYVGSTITVTGTNFIPGFACTARVGATPSSGTAATSCLVLTATRTVVVIGAGTPAGASSVEVTFTNGAAVATVSGTTLTMLLSPTAVSIAPTSAYVGSTITVTGTNFIPGFACTARVGATPSSGTAATSCLVPSVSSVVVVIGAGTPAGASSVEVTFTNGAAVATVSGTTLTMLLSPTAVSIAPTSAYVGSTITVTGTNFIPGFACIARVGATPSSGTAATSCSVPSVSSVVVVIGAGTPAGASSVEVTFSNSNTKATVQEKLLAIFGNPTIFNVSTFGTAIPFTGAGCITVFGNNFLNVNPSLSMRIGATGCKSSLWESISSLVCKSGRSIWEATAVTATVSRLKFSFLRPSVMLIFQNVSVNMSSAPCSGSINAIVFGRGIGSVSYSAKHRFTGSSFEASRWLSDSCIQHRSNAGVLFLKTALRISLPGRGSSVSTICSSMSYDAPTMSPSISILLRLNNISIAGSNFGTHNGMFPLQSRITYAPSLPLTLSARINITVCEVNTVDLFQRGLKIARAVFSLALVQVIRLDDVSVFIDVLREGAVVPSTYILVSNKCACFVGSSASFEFQALPPGLPQVPAASCAAAGRYSLESAPDVMDALAVPGKWMLRVMTGAFDLKLLSASIQFVAESLEFRIGASVVSAMSWIADSSVVLQVPGYQNGTTISRASGGGYGRNLSVTVVVNRLISPNSINYSYPNPVASDLSAPCVPTTGSALAALSGHAFANVASSPGVRLTLTACASSFWTSDSSVTCRLSSMRGIVPLLTLTVAFSAVSSLNSDAVQGAPSVSSFSSSCRVSSGGNIMSVLGASFGIIGNYSVRVRSQSSASSSTIWASDTAIAFRPPHLMSSSSLILSLCDFNSSMSGFNSSLVTIFVPPVVSGSSPNIMAATGGSLLLATGMFGKASASIRLSLSGTSCTLTDWTSHSSLNCKTAWGAGAQITMIASMARLNSHATKLAVLYAEPQVSNRFAFTNASQFNSTTCLFANATMCSLSQIVGFVSSASGFGAFRRDIKVDLEGRQCADVTWSSDSALYCVYPHEVSKSLFTLNFILTITNGTANMTQTSYLSVLNPLFFPLSPHVNTSLFSVFYWPGDDAPSNVAIETYQRLGRASGANIKPPRISAAVAEFFESISVKVIVYINDTVNPNSQMFMDSNFVPISKTITGKFSLLNASSGADASAVFCRPRNITSITLLPEKYAAVAVFEMSFCSPAHGVLSLVFSSSSTNEYGDVVDLPVDQMSVSVRPAGTASLSINLQTMPQFIVGNAPASLYIQYNSGLLCSRTQFEFVVALECQSPTSQSFNSFAFKKSKRGPKSSLFIEYAMNCDVTLSDLWFVEPASNCILNVSVPLARLSATSTAFAVLPGTGSVCQLLGPRVNCESAGALIWSIHNSSRRCLGVQLLDEEGNNASSTQSFVVALARDSNMTAYALLGSQNYSIDSDGVILWCQLFSTQVTHKEVSVGVAVGENVAFLPGSLNVTSPGFAAMLSVASITNQSSTRFVPGQSLPSINFTVTDVAGNAVAKVAKSFVIRIFVRPRRATSTSRRLLQTTEVPMSSVCPSFTYVNVSEGSAGVVSVSPPLLCTAGENDIFYSIGEMIGDVFVPSFNLELATVVTVMPGPFDSFTIGAPQQFRAQTYSLIRDVEIHFRDKGMNIVSGNAMMRMRPVDASFLVYPSYEFHISSNGTEKVTLPPFFLSTSGWNAASSGSPLLISVLGTVKSSDSSVIAMNMTATCAPGTRLSFPSGNSSVEFVYISLLSGHNVACSFCTKPQFGTWLFDTPDCLTLTYTNAPVIVHSGKSLSIKGIEVTAEGGHIASYAPNWTVLLRLQQRNFTISAVNASVMLQQGRSQPTTTVPAYADKPSSDYFWVLQLRADMIGSSPNFNVTLPQNVTVLDFAPASLRIVPSSLSQSGHALITVSGFFPSFVFQPTAFSSSVLPALRDNRCLFQSSSLFMSMNLEAKISNFSSNQISFVCGPLLFGDTVRKNWSVSMLLSDGRESAEVLIESYCPPGMYIEPNATVSCTTPPCCLACPSPVSASAVADSLGIRSCRCQIGHYGSSGSLCKACPKNPRYGFNCTVPELMFPLVKLGFFIDYSLLATCTEERCVAVVKCPNTQACPGFGDRNCLDTESECYSNRAMGCTLCCTGYYSENYTCRKCPESRLVAVLALAVVLLILFAILSTYVSFPPLVATAKGTKLILSGFQSFACVRLMAGISTDNEGVLSGVNWPQSMLSAFEFLNAFTFSFDSLRPECSIDFSARAKLILISVCPALAVSGVLLLSFIYGLSKIRSICSHIKSLNLLPSDSNALFLSVGHCFLVSTFSLKYSRDNQIRYGPLWPALSPALVERSDIAVVVATTRRQRAVAAPEDGNHRAFQGEQLQKLPRTWLKMLNDFSDAGVPKLMSDATATARLIVSSAFSIFIITYQGVLETMLSTWDCKDIDGRKFLRYRPDIECSSTDNHLYAEMMMVSSVGVAFYTFILPLCVIAVMRSRWAREIYAFNFVAYDQLFGFITNQYCTAFMSWEAINCIRKVLIVAIPQAFTSSPIIQSILNILLFLVYAMTIVAFKPMVSSFLNNIEVLNSCNIIVSSFAAMLFTVQYQNVYVLQGESKEVVGIVLIAFIIFIFSISIRLIYLEFIRLYALHQNSYLSKWLRVILTTAGDSIRLDRYLPISLLFVNKTSSVAIQQEIDADDLKRKQVISDIEKVWFPNGISVSFIGYFVLAWAKVKLRLNLLRRSSNYEVDAALAKQSLAEPDYKFFVWMHKLLQRTMAWKPREKVLRHASFLELPKMFTANFGESDPPIAVCDSLLRTSRAVDEILNEDHKNLLLAFMIQGEQLDVRANLDNGKSRHYQLQMRDMVESFKQRIKIHLDASEVFSNSTENELKDGVFRPCRKQFCAARQSEDIKVLRQISTTTLPQYLNLQKSLSAHKGATCAPEIDAAQVEHTTNHDFALKSSHISPTEYEVSENLSTLQAHGRSNDVIPERTSTPRYEMRAAAKPGDCFELQEVVIERLDEAKKKSIPSIAGFPSESAISQLPVLHQTRTSSDTERGSPLPDEVESAVQSPRERVDQSRSVGSKCSSPQIQFVAQSSAAAYEATDSSLQTTRKGHLNTESPNVDKTAKTTALIPPHDWSQVIKPFMTETTVERSPYRAEILNPATACVESEKTRGGSAAVTAAASAVGTGKSLSAQSPKGQFEGNGSLPPYNLLPDGQERFSLVHMVKISANRMPIRNQAFAESHDAGNQPIVQSPALAQDPIVKHSSTLSNVMKEATSARDAAHPVDGKSTTRSPIARSPRTVAVSAMGTSSKGSSAQRVSARFRVDTNRDSVLETKPTMDAAPVLSASLRSEVAGGSRAVDVTQASQQTPFVPASDKSPLAYLSLKPLNHDRSKHGAC
jgi:hypothetical protein